ncbi:MAG: hypothetical protein IKD91_06090 [Clostridiales bacterium]|jgi:hypothetical protein|nr:hypothetical protein [Clostridiales bacterium]MBR3143362.1 hypothetical protein [Clostridiales bacterium]
MGTAAWYELMQGLQYLGDMLEKMWAILTTSPQNFKGGGIWNVITSINGVLGAIGTALLVLFFTVGVIKTCGSFAELKKPETAVKVFIRFAIAKYLIDNCLKLMVNFVTIVQGVISKITSSSPIGTALEFTIPSSVQGTFDGIGILDGAIPIWAVCFIAHIALIIISIVLLLTVYGRFFRIYMYTAIAPIPLSTLAGQPTENIAKSFLKSYAGVCMQGVVIVLACIIFTAYSASMPQMDTSVEPIKMVWGYVTEVVFNMLVLLGLVKGSDRIIHDMMGL